MLLSNVALECPYAMSVERVNLQETETGFPVPHPSHRIINWSWLMYCHFLWKKRGEITKRIMANWFGVEDRASVYS